MSKRSTVRNSDLFRELHAESDRLLKPIAAKAKVIQDQIDALQAQLVKLEDDNKSILEDATILFDVAQGMNLDRVYATEEQVERYNKLMSEARREPGLSLECRARRF